MQSMRLQATSVTHNTTASKNPAIPVDMMNSPATSANPAVDVSPVYMPVLSEEEAAGQAFLLKALANSTRLRILDLLSRYEGKVSVLEIVENFALEQPTISHHLHILRYAGLIDCEKKGISVYYYLRRDSLKQAQDMITELVQ